MIQRFKRSPILIGASSVAFATILVKAISFLKDVVIAGKIGLAPALDVYLFGMSLLELILSLLVGALQYTFIPVIARADAVQSGGGRGLIQEMYSSIVTLLLTFGALVFALVSVFDYRLQEIPGASALAAADQLPYVMRVGAAVVVAYSLSVISQGLLQAKGHYFWPALCRMTTPVSLSIAILLADPVALRDGSIEALRVLVYGTAVGTVLETAWMVSLLKIRTGIICRPGALRLSAEMVRMLRQTALLLIGTACSAGIMFIERVFAAQEGDGRVASLTFAYKLTSVTISVFALSLSSSMLPHLSKLWAQNQFAEAKQLVGKYARWIFVAVMPGALLASYFSTEIVSLLYERGAFEASDSARVGGIQAIFLLSLPFYLMGVPANRMILAMGKAQVLALFSLLALISTYFLNSVLVPRYGLEGIAMTSLILHSAMSLAFVLYCRVALPLNPAQQVVSTSSEVPSIEQ